MPPGSLCAGTPGRSAQFCAAGTARAGLSLLPQNHTRAPLRVCVHVGWVCSQRHRGAGAQPTSGQAQGRARARARARGVFCLRRGRPRFRCKGGHTARLRKLRVFELKGPCALCGSATGATGPHKPGEARAVRPKTGELRGTSPPPRQGPGPHVPSTPWSANGSGTVLAHILPHV